MIKNYYKISIEGRDVKYFLKTLYKMKIYFLSINISNNIIYAIVDDKNFKKLMSIKTSYDISIIRTYGFNYFKEVFRKNFFFLFFSFLGLITVLILSNIIFDVEIVHNDSFIKEKLYDELKEYGIKKYSFSKNYSQVQEIKNNILEINKDDIEWMEIEKVGCKYIIRFEERIINDIKEDNNEYGHIVASKEGIIKKIDAYNGEVSVKVNDYVSKGDILISGQIHKNDDILGNTSAKGDIYAEVWYKAKVSIPINYYEKKYTGHNKKVINFSFLDYSFNLFDFNSYRNKEVISKNIYSDFFNIFNINYNKEKEVIIKDDVILMINDDIAISLAKEKIESRLKDGEYIISQKKLKTFLNDSTIKVEVFFKVYENISQYKKYELGDVIE